MALLLLSVTAIFGRQLTFGSTEFELFVYTAAAYVTFSLLCFLVIASRRHFHLQLGVQVSADIGFIVVLMFASGGISSGLGLLLLSGLAAAGLISRGRLTLFYAALASIAVLIEHTVQVLVYSGQTTQYVQAGLLSIGYFTTAWVAHTLAKYLVATEQLVAQREIDLASMAEVSQLVIQDMHDGVLVVDEHGVIRQHNARVEEMLGPLYGQRREQNLRSYAPVLAHRLDEWRKNPVVVGIDAVSTVVQNNRISARFVPVGRSRNVGAVIFLEDISRVQAQARQLKLAALGRLTANIAHEVRNPLSAISHATELLQEEPALNDTVTRLLTIIHDNAKRLDRMVNDVLKLDRGERAHREVFLVGDYLKTFTEQFCQIEKVPAVADRARTRGGHGSDLRSQSFEPGDVEPLPQRAAALPRRRGEHPHRGRFDRRREHCKIGRGRRRTGRGPGGAQPVIRAVFYHRGQRHGAGTLHRARSVRG